MASCGFRYFMLCPQGRCSDAMQYKAAVHNYRNTQSLKRLGYACRGPGRIQLLPRPLKDQATKWLREKGMTLRPPGAPLGVCIMSADFWGLKTAGGTATAYHLLAQVLQWGIPFLLLTLSRERVTVCALLLVMVVNVVLWWSLFCNPWLLGFQGR